MEKKLVITSKKYRGDSVVISSRITGELVKRLDEIAVLTGRTRNDLVQTCLEFAVDNLKIEGTVKKEKSDNGNS